MHDENKLQELKQSISDLKEQDKRHRKEGSNYLKHRDSFGIAVELVSGVVVGLFAGLFLDKLFASKPIFVIICLMLGICGSIRIIWHKFNNSKNGP